MKLKTALLTESLISAGFGIYCTFIKIFKTHQVSDCLSGLCGNPDTLPPKLDSQTLILIYNPFAMQFPALCYLSEGMRERRGTEEHIIKHKSILKWFGHFLSNRSK